MKMALNFKIEIEFCSESLCFYDFLMIEKINQNNWHYLEFQYIIFRVTFISANTATCFKRYIKFSL